MRHILLLVAGVAVGFTGLVPETGNPRDDLLRICSAAAAGVLTPELALGYAVTALARNPGTEALESWGILAASAFGVRLYVTSGARLSIRDRLSYERRLRARLSDRPGRPVEAWVHLVNTVSQVLVWLPLGIAVAIATVDDSLNPLLAVLVGALATAACAAGRARTRAMSRYDRCRYLVNDITAQMAMLLVFVSDHDKLPGDLFGFVQTAGSLMFIVGASTLVLTVPARAVWPLAHQAGSLAGAPLLAYVCLVQPSSVAVWSSIVTSLWVLAVFTWQIRRDVSPLWWSRAVSAHNFRRDNTSYDAHVAGAWLYDEVNRPTGLALPHAMAAQAVASLTRENAARRQDPRSLRVAARLTMDDQVREPWADRAVNEGRAWLEAAEELIDAAEQYVSEDDVARARADCRFSRGQVLEAAADWTGAEAAYRAAATAFTRAGLPDFAALAKLYRARLLAERLDRRAEAEAERRSIAADAGLLAPARRWAGADLPADADLSEFHRREGATGRPFIRDLRAPAPPWRPLAGQAPPVSPPVENPGIPLHRPVGDGPAKRLIDRGEQHWRRGRLDDAAQDLSEAAALLEEDSQERTALQVLMELARRQAKHDPLAAFETLNGALKLQERLREKADDEQLRMHVNGWFEALHTRQIALLSTGSGPGWPERPALSAFDLAERGRSRLLLQQLAETADLGADGVPAEMVHRERTQLAEVRRRRASLNSRGEQIRALAELRAARRELADIWRTLARTGTRGAEYVQMRRGDPLTFTDVEPLLGQALLAEYHVTDDAVVVLLGASGAAEPTIARVPMPRAELARALDGGFGTTDATSMRGWDALAPLVDPLLRNSEPGQVLWIVPHDLLHGVPLHAFEVDGAPLISRNPVCYTPAATVMRYCQAKRRPTARTSVVLADSRAERPLPHSRAQSSLVRSLLDPATGFVGPDATATAMVEAVRGGVSVLHIACHGEFDAEQPARSHVLLAEDDADDGLLTAERILGMALPADLVTLSACHSGAAHRRPGDELFGLTRTLIYAGASAVLVSLWAVDEVATGLLMYSFYKARNGGEGKAEALRTAQLAVRDATLQDIIDYCARVGGDHGVHARQVADARFRARDFTAAAAAYADLLDVPGNEDDQDLRAAHARAALARKGRGGEPDYAKKIYPHPYYWAGFVLIGDWH
ncbi:CHAT domain-containing protein [Spirillospora sp. NPDC047418]